MAQLEDTRWGDFCIQRKTEKGKGEFKGLEQGHFWECQ